jgi:hypothetical protein
MGNASSGSQRPGSEAARDARRRAVTSLLLRRGASVAEVHRSLEADPRLWNHTVSPPSPWSYRTVAQDVRWLTAQWRLEASNQLAEALSRQLAELAELKAAAWQKGRLSVVLGCLDREAKLLGLARPRSDTELPWQYPDRQSFEREGLAAFRVTAKSKSR